MTQFWSKFSSRLLLLSHSLPIVVALCVGGRALLPAGRVSGLWPVAAHLFEGKFSWLRIGTELFTLQKPRNPDQGFDRTLFRERTQNLYRQPIRGDESSRWVRSRILQHALEISFNS